MVSQLSLDFPNTKSVKTLRVSDSSWYNKKIKYECGKLEVTPPGYKEPVIFNVTKGFTTVLNSSNLKLKKAKVYSDLGPLPDGVYKIKYSMKPNDELWVEYDYLRTDMFWKSYYEILCSLKLEGIEPSATTNAKIKDLRKIKLYMQTAEAEVGVCNNRSRGVDLYNYANKLLGDFKKSACSTC